jgi:hypothetical protein
MDARLAALGPPDMQGRRLAEFDLRPLKLASLNGPQAVPPCRRGAALPLILQISIAPAATLHRRLAMASFLSFHLVFAPHQ